MIPDHTQYLLNKDHQHHKCQPQKSWTQYQDNQDAQAADAVSAENQVENGGCSKIIENSKVRMSRHLDSSTEAQIAKIMVQ